jgi:hypothetical protein
MSMSIVKIIAYIFAFAKTILPPIWKSASVNAKSILDTQIIFINNVM